MGKDDRLSKAEQTGYGLLSDDDGEEIWGRLELPSTLGFDGREWVLYRRDFDLNPVGHEVLGDAGLDPARAFAALKELDPEGSRLAALSLAGAYDHQRRRPVRGVTDPWRVPPTAAVGVEAVM